VTPITDQQLQWVRALADTANGEVRLSRTILLQLLARLDDAEGSSEPPPTNDPRALFGGAA